MCWAEGGDGDTEKRLSVPMALITWLLGLWGRRGLIYSKRTERAELGSVPAEPCHRNTPRVEVLPLAPGNVTLSGNRVFAGGQVKMRSFWWTCVLIKGGNLDTDMRTGPGPWGGEGRDPRVMRLQTKQHQRLLVDHLPRGRGLDRSTPTPAPQAGGPAWLKPRSKPSSLQNPETRRLWHCHSSLANDRGPQSSLTQSCGGGGVSLCFLTWGGWEAAGINDQVTDQHTPGSSSLGVLGGRVKI